jgi:hypothetical protein
MTAAVATGSLVDRNLRFGRRDVAAVDEVVAHEEAAPALA